MDSSHRLTQAFVQAHPLEAAQCLESIPPQEAAHILTPLQVEDMALVLGYCLPVPGAEILEGLPVTAAGEVLSALAPSSATAIFRQVDPERQKSLLDGLPHPLGFSLRRSLIYPDHTAGSLADARILTLPPDISMERAISWVKREKRYATYYLYVIDRDAKLEGVVTMKQLLTADPDDFVATVMNDQVVSLPADATADELVHHPHWQLFHTLPVVDRQGVFLGALRSQTLKKIEGETVIQRTPGALPQALLKLWEVYSLAGIRIMTEVAESVTKDSTAEAVSQIREKDPS